jgi:chlorobactene glucosyltransferase
LLTLKIITWCLLVFVAMGGCYWLAVLGRLVRTLILRRPTVRAGLDTPEPEGGWPRLSVIVPAHNEERVIDACVTSLRQQRYADLEMIFVLDRCTDRTRELVQKHADEDPRVRIVENDSCPDGWAGKCNAARLGADVATGEYLLFTDADTQFEPDLCRASVGLIAAGGVSLLTLLSTLTGDRYHERVAQPVATINLIHLYPIERASRARDPRPFANGQFMMFQREWYDRIGGHTAVKEELLEDLAFARQIASHQGRTSVLLADGMLRCSMYETSDAFAEGWRRIFIDACKRKPRRLRKLGFRTLAGGIAIPVAQLAALPMAGMLIAWGATTQGMLTLVVVAAALLIQLLALLTIYPLAGAPRWATVTFPIGCWIVARILLRAASGLERRVPLTWGGREYVPEPR